MATATTMVLLPHHYEGLTQPGVNLNTRLGMAWVAFDEFRSS